MSITQSQADTAIAAARNAADAIGVPMNIAVYDDGANLKAFLRMDGAFLGSADIALNKARTAALFGFNTETLYDFVKPAFFSAMSAEPRNAPSMRRKALRFAPSS